MRNKIPHNIGTPDPDSDQFEQDVFDAENSDVDNKQIVDGVAQILQSTVLLQKRQKRENAPPEEAGEQNSTF